MKTLKLTDEQYDLLIDIVLEERNAIRGSLEYFGDERQEEIDRYNMLAEMFDFEEWTD